MKEDINTSYDDARTMKMGTSPEQKVPFVFHILLHLILLNKALCNGIMMSALTYFNV